jgi:hypothetical protein
VDGGGVWLRRARCHEERSHVEHTEHSGCGERRQPGAGEQHTRSERHPKSYAHDATRGEHTGHDAAATGNQQPEHGCSWQRRDERTRAWR